jgi:hypothetical protein
MYTSALAQNQLNLVEAAHIATRTTPGEIYRVELRPGSTRTWEFWVSIQQWLGSRVLVDSGSLRVRQAFLEDNDPLIPRSLPVNWRAAAQAAHAHVESREAEDTQVRTVALARGAQGPIWNVTLTSLSKRGVAYQVVLDALNGDVLSLETRVD